MIPPSLNQNQFGRVFQFDLNPDGTFKHKNDNLFIVSIS